MRGVVVPRFESGLQRELRVPSALGKRIPGQTIEAGPCARASTASSARIRMAKRRRRKGPSRQVGYCIAHAQWRGGACCSAWRCCLRTARRRNNWPFDPTSSSTATTPNSEIRFEKAKRFSVRRFASRAEIALNERVTVSAGGFANQRFGSENAFEQARPVLSLTVRGRRSSFVLGTLPPATSPACLLGPIAAVPTDCSRPCSGKRFHSTVRTKLAWRGRSTARDCSITSGSSGSASTLPSIASGLTAACARHIAWPIS